MIGEQQRELKPTLLHQATAEAQVSVTSLGETTRGKLKNLQTLKNEFIPLSDWKPKWKRTILVFFFFFCNNTQPIRRRFIKKI